MKKTLSLCILTCLINSSLLAFDFNPKTSISEDSKRLDVAKEISPIITFDSETKPLKNKPVEEIKKAEFTMSQEAQRRHALIQRYILEGNIVVAFKETESFIKDKMATQYFTDFTQNEAISQEIEYAVSLLNMAQIQRILGDYLLAASYAQKALTIFNSYRQQLPIDYFMSGPVILDSMWDSGFYELGDKHQSIVTSSCSSILPNSAIHGKLLIHEAIGLVKRWNKPSDASKVLLKARQIFTGDPGLASIEYASVPYYEALLSMESSDFLNVLALLDVAEKELEVVVKTTYPNNQIFGDIHLLYGKAYLGSFNNKGAEKRFLEAIKFFENTIGKKNLKVAEVYRELAIAQKYDKKFDDAIKNAAHAINTIIEIKGDNAITLIDHYMTLAGIYMDSGNPKLAISYFEKAKDMNARHRGRYNDVARIIGSNIKYIKQTYSQKLKHMKEIEDTNTSSIKKQKLPEF